MQKGLGVIEGFRESFIEQRRIERSLRRMGKKPKVIDKSVEERLPAHRELMMHPALFGCKSSNDVLKAVIRLHDEMINLRLKLYNSDFKRRYWEKKYELVYNIGYGDASKNIPSQKNQYGIRKGGLYKGDETKKFRADLMFQWDMAHDERPKIPHVFIDITVYFPSLRASDLDGKVTTILDALKAGGVIDEDNFKQCAFNARAIFRKGKAGCDLKLFQMSEQEYNKMIGIE